MKFWSWQSCLILSITLIAPACAMAQDTGDVATGRALATRLCTSCHRIKEEHRDPKRSPPDLGAVADRPEMSKTALIAFLQTRHSKTVRRALTPDELDDLTAYVSSLKQR